MGTAPKVDEKYTYKDYLNWPEDERWELINGEAFSMSPAPMRRHQQVLRRVTRAFDRYLEDKSCELYFAPFDVKLSEVTKLDEMVDTVVQPDLLIVCDESKLDERGCNGAPDLVVEILSESTAARDLHIKKDLYEKHGVINYLIANPWDNTITVHHLTDGKFRKPKVFVLDEVITLEEFPGLEVELNKIFQ